MQATHSCAAFRAFPINGTHLSIFKVTFRFIYLFINLFIYLFIYFLSLFFNYLFIYLIIFFFFFFYSRKCRIMNILYCFNYGKESKIKKHWSRVLESKTFYNIETDGMHTVMYNFQR